MRSCNSSHNGMAIFQHKNHLLESKHKHINYIFSWFSALVNNRFFWRSNISHT